VNSQSGSAKITDDRPLAVAVGSGLRVGRSHRVAQSRNVLLGGILFSNTLGTGLGDFFSDDPGLGYRWAAIVFAGMLALVPAAYFRTKASRTLWFWLAFISHPSGSVRQSAALGRKFFLICFPYLPRSS
jgi:hypothetical protein